MSKRHWLRDEIDFAADPHVGGPYETCGDECPGCNAAAQEIADSIALDGSGHYTADYGIKYNRLGDWARINVAYAEREQCDDVRLQFLSAKYICWIKEVNDAEETDLSLS